MAVPFLQTKWEQCILSEITFKNKKKDHVISWYRSPLQTPDQFDNFLQPFEELLQDIFKTFVTESGVHSSLCSTCYHQIAFEELKFEFPLPMNVYPGTIPELSRLQSIEQLIL